MAKDVFQKQSPTRFIGTSISANVVRVTATAQDKARDLRGIRENSLGISYLVDILHPRAKVISCRR